MDPAFLVVVSRCASHVSCPAVKQRSNFETPAIRKRTDNQPRGKYGAALSKFKVDVSPEKLLDWGCG